jgi:hypothetical protein
MVVLVIEGPENQNPVLYPAVYVLQKFHESFQRQIRLKISIAGKCNGGAYVILQDQIEQWLQQLQAV